MKRLIAVMLAITTCLAYNRGGLWESLIPLAIVLVFSIGWMVSNVRMGLPYDYNTK